MTDQSRTNGTSPEALEADIERQRDELAETVSALQHKLDVRSRAQDKAAELKDRATTDAGRPRPQVLGAAVVAAAALVGLVAWRIRRR